MAEFDYELWKARAWERFGRALRSGKPKRVIEPAWVADVLAVDSLSVLVEWCRGRGLKVDFVKKTGGTYYPGSKEVKISSRLSPTNQVVYLLHECGHHLIGMKEHDERFGMGYPQTDPAVKRTFQHKLACLDEEIEAWHRGWRLACRLGIRIDPDAYESVRLKCLRSYVKWSLTSTVKDD